MKDNLTGQRFGRLVVQEPGISSHSGQRWTCLCDCGQTCMPFGFGLKNGTTKSCGCYSDEVRRRPKTHGGTHLPEYKIWEAMFQRCTNRKHTSYKNYGAKGVTICARWQNFAAFFEDMGPRPSHKHSIDRKDSTLGYSKENCVGYTQRTEQSYKSQCFSDVQRKNTNSSAVGRRARLTARATT